MKKLKITSRRIFRLALLLFVMLASSLTSGSNISADDAASYDDPAIVDTLAGEELTADELVGPEDDELDPEDDELDSDVLGEEPEDEIGEDDQPEIDEIIDNLDKVDDNLLEDNHLNEGINNNILKEGESKTTEDNFDDLDDDEDIVPKILPIRIGSRGRLLGRRQIVTFGRNFRSFSNDYIEDESGKYPENGWQPEGHEDVINYPGSNPDNDRFDGDPENLEDGYLDYSDAYGNETANLRKFAKETETQGLFDVYLNIRGHSISEPTAVVFINDWSGSMNQNVAGATPGSAPGGSWGQEAKIYKQNEAMRTILAALEDRNDYEIGFVGYSSNYGRVEIGGIKYKGSRTGYYGDNAILPLQSAATAVPAINALLTPLDTGVEEEGGTFTQKALLDAQALLANSSASRKIIVLLTDGQPTASYPVTSVSQLAPGTYNDTIITNGVVASSYNTNINPHANPPVYIEMPMTSGGSTGFWYSGTLINSTDYSATKPYLVDGHRINSAWHALIGTALDIQDTGTEIYGMGLNITDQYLGTNDEGIVINQDDIANAFRDLTSSDKHYFDVRNESDLNAFVHAIIRDMPPKTVLDGIITDPIGAEFVPEGIATVTSVGPKTVANLPSFTFENGTFTSTPFSLGENEEIQIHYQVRIQTENDSFEPDTWHQMNGRTTVKIPNPEDPNNPTIVDFGIPSAKAKGVEIEGVKIWNDLGSGKKLPDSITVFLMRKVVGSTDDPTQIAEATIQPDENGTWKIELPNQIKFNNNGEDFEYSFTDNLSEYDATYDPETGNLINTLIPEPSISLTKSTERDDLVVGDLIEYTFKSVNTGNLILYKVHITDPLVGLSEIEYISLNGAPITDPDNITMGLGDILIAKATYTITQDDVDRGFVKNTATVTGTALDLPEDHEKREVSDDDNEYVGQPQEPVIKLDKTSFKKVVTELNERIVYAFTVTNKGNVTLTNVTLTDPMFGGNITLDQTTLAPGEETTGTAIYYVTQEDLDRGYVYNTATVEGTPPVDPENPDEPDKVTDMDDETVLVAAIKLEKDGDKTTVSKAGEDIVYTFTVTNTGKVELTDVTLTDPMFGGEITLGTTTLAPGESTIGSATYKATQEDVNRGYIDNEADVVGTPVGYDPTNPNAPKKVTDEDDFQVKAPHDPDIKLEKTSSKKVVTGVGEEIVYSFKVTNTGNVTLTNVTLTDPMLGGDITLGITTLDPGEFTFGTGSYNVSEENMVAGNIKNTAIVEGIPPVDPENPDGPNKVNDEDDETVLVAAIKLVKDGDKTTVSTAGEDVIYTFTVTNTGHVTLNNVTLNDPMLGGDITLVTTTLAPGESTTGSATYKATQVDIDLGYIDNVANVEGEPEGYNPDDPNAPKKVTDEDDFQITAPHDPAIKLEKTGDKLSVIKVNEDIVYTFTVTNTGNVTLTNVTLNDPMLGGNITLGTTTLAPGDSTTATVTYKTTQTDIDASSIDNEAEVEGTPPGYDPEDPDGPDKVTDTDDYQVLVPHGPAIHLEKISSKKVVTEAGEEIIYTFTVTNIGNVTLSNVTLNDPMLGGNIVLVKTILAPEESTTGTGTYTVTEDNLIAGIIENTANVEGTPPGYDPNEPNGPQKVSDEDDETVLVAKIKLEKDGDKTTVSEAGEDIIYTFTVTNTGNVTLNNVTLNDPMLGGDITLVTTTLAPGESTTGSATYKATQADADAGYIDNVANVEGEPEGYNPEDPNAPKKVVDEDDYQVTVPHNPAIKLEKTSSKKVVTEAGEEVIYSFKVTNTGNVTLTDVTLNDPMLGGNIILGVTTLAPGEFTTGTGSYTVTEANMIAGLIENTANVEGTPPGYDPNEPNGPQKVSDEDDETVLVAAIKLVKDGDKTTVSEAGEDIIYTFTVTNTGNVTLNNVTLNDPMLGGDITLDITTLAPGESTTGSATYKALQVDIDRGSIDNVANVEGEPEGYNPEDPNAPKKVVD